MGGPTVFMCFSFALERAFRGRRSQISLQQSNLPNPLAIAQKGEITRSIHASKQQLWAL